MSNTDSNMQANIYGANHIASLTGLRAVGALLVVFFHFHAKDAAWYIEPVVKSGGALGLALFFSLSGYILVTVYDDKLYLKFREYMSFMGKRIARIYPLHIFLVIFLLILYPRLNLRITNTEVGLFHNLLLTHGWGFHKNSSSTRHGPSA